MQGASGEETADAEKRDHFLAAAMNVLLAYYHLEDDWEDDRKVSSLAAKKMLQGKAKRIIEISEAEPGD